jgi:hypothetical protein
MYQYNRKDRFEKQLMRSLPVSNEDKKPLTSKDLERLADQFVENLKQPEYLEALKNFKFPPRNKTAVEAPSSVRPQGTEVTYRVTEADVRLLKDLGIVWEGGDVRVRKT